MRKVILFLLFIVGIGFNPTYGNVLKQRVTFSGITVDIEILSVKAIENGIEVLARAYDTKGKPIGFGDGTVEIERFKIYNPPILVDDINGTIIRKEPVEFGATEFIDRRLREDPLQAVLETLAHNIKVVGKRNASVIKNKIGNTTSTFYPLAGTVSPVDGYTERAGVSETWATIIAGAGTAAFPSATSLYLVHSAKASPPSNRWQAFSRIIITFDSSPIATDNITSATLSLWGVSKTDPLSITPDMNIYTSAPANTNNLVAADHGTLGSIPQTDTTLTYANFTTGAYNDFVFNATGRGNISKTGISKFGARSVNYDVNGNAPAWTSNLNSYFEMYSADDGAGTTRDPKLVVVHDAPASFAPTVTWW